ncbi:MAG: hypothetical protein HS132_00745 [Planctomycetia bacterium]|nr:hypothetical protein [Planctomycetia bacterium]
MADVHNKKTTCLRACLNEIARNQATHRQRSYTMSMIRSKDTKPEIGVIKFLINKVFKIFT